MNIHWKSVIVTLLTLATVGFFAAAAWIGFGLYNVSARLGHFPGMSWVFYTTYRNAVDLWSDDSKEVPEAIESAAMIELGAKHYEQACRTCHAAPGAMRVATARAMLPQPPHITEAVERWGPIELHWIVYEGVKMSGMPGWPAAREDEVWSVVAFLQAVQRGMTPKEYQDLTRLQRSEPSGLGTCIACHGAEGRTENAWIPRLDILSERYMTVALQSYLDGSRQSGIMEHAASEIPQEQLVEAAGYFAGYVPPDQPSTDDGPALSDMAQAGRDLALSGGPSDAGGGNVPSCAACHGPWDAELDTLFPSLAGQNQPYLAAQLRLWREERRGGGVASQLMHEASRHLTDADIDALAAYYAGLHPAELNDVSDRR